MYQNILMDKRFLDFSEEDVDTRKKLKERHRRRVLYCESFHCGRQTTWICDTAVDGMGNTVIESGELWDEVAGRKYHHGCPARH